MIDWGIVATTIGTLIAAYLTFKGVMGKAKVDKEAISIPALIEGWEKRADKAENDITRAGERIAALEHRVDALGAENEELRAENRQLRDTLRDRDELLEDYRQHSIDQAAWRDSGSPPPPPAQTWRQRRDLEEHIATLTARQGIGDSQ